jgi:uncharacterized membrane protein YccF (DUF307 family)
MRTLGNILWHFPFLGFLTALWTFLIGLFLVITIAGMPVGLGLIQFSRFLLTPFSMSMIPKSDLKPNQNLVWRFFQIIVRILYFPVGLVLSVIVICQMIGLVLSIVGFPVALVLAKSLGTFFNPVNKICVPIEVENELHQRKARQRVDRGFAL